MLEAIENAVAHKKIEKSAASLLEVDTVLFLTWPNFQDGYVNELEG
jgi:hypothetical protein